MSQRSNDHELLTRYLLGSASVAEREAVEDRYFADQSGVDELLLAEDDLIDDYVRGALTEPERSLFEKNFLCTAGRRRRLEFTRDLAKALAHTKAVEGSDELFNMMRLGQLRTAFRGAPEHETTAQSEKLRGQLTPDSQFETFGGLLKWLDPVLERAAEKYEAVRRRLIEMFTLRGYVDAEALADKTLDRVARRVSEFGDTYSGDPIRYIYGVARYVLQEYTHMQRQSENLIQKLEADTDSGLEQTHGCLEKCLGRLSPSDRELILQYYSVGGVGKESSRRELSQNLGISLNAMRIRVHRLRVGLRECIKSCLEQSR